MRDVIDFSSAHRTILQPTPAPASLATTVVLDEDVRRWFAERASPAGDLDLATLVNAALRDHVRRAGEPFERTLRRVLREELRKVG